jgi:hypothetical protein
MVYKVKPERRILPYPDKERRRMEDYFRISAGTL